MKTLLFTGYDDKMAPLGDLTAPLMEKYAKRHGMTFECIRKPLTEPLSMYWVGAWFAAPMLNLFKRVIYLDADQKITNFDYELPDWKTGFHASKDWGVDAIDSSHFSMCGFVAHQDSKSLFIEAVRIEPEWRDKPFPEQAPMRHIYLSRPLRPAMVIHPRKVFNNVPIEVHPSVPEPWQPGDWCAHLTMLNLEERIKLFHAIG